MIRNSRSIIETAKRRSSGMAIIAIAICLTAGLRADGNEMRMISAKLQDGSMVRGHVALDASLLLRTDFANDQIPFHLIHSVRLKDDKKTVVVEFQNGDQLTGALGDKSVTLKSTSGERELDLGEIATLQVLAPLSLPAKLRESLVLHYGFDVGGEQAIDHSGNGMNGMIKGAERTPDGKHNHALQFADGDYVEMGNPMRLALQKLTVAAWIRFETSRTKNRFWIFKGELGEPVLDNADLRDHHVKDRGLDYGFQLYNSSASPSTFTSAVGNVSGHSTFQPVVNTWFHVASTYDGEGHAKHYVNGKLIEHTHNRGKLGAIPDRYPWRIGAWVGQFTGKADEVMFFNRALKHDEVKQLYEAMD